MLSRIGIAFAAVLAATVATAQSSLLPSTELMRELATRLYRGLNEMVKQEAPFDAAAVERHMTALIAAAERIPTVFPDSSKGKMSANTRYSASPKVWANNQDFERHAVKLAEVLRGNREKAATLDGLKAVYSTINDTCNSCHETYRLRKS
jgi:cytochrome c556